MYPKAPRSQLEREMKHGKTNFADGLLFMAGFMLFGFAQIYLRGFGLSKEQQIAEYAEI